ncbi:RCC1 and BTB domain-containing protein 1-like [Planococcus citri]|uniref:RCC1 and BTB domain-containing protein 1-like n=1 Tax=Planococcus citri TaxID=170843 RepID=UPI0031F8A5A7
MKMASIRLENYVIFSKLSKELISRIKFVHIFGAGKNAIIVTTLDEVFIVGDNDKEYLGFNSSPNPMEPVLIPELCNKEIKGFAFGSGPHILAFNEQGQVFGWGYNNSGQAGVVGEDRVTVPTMISAISTKVFIQAACGSEHSLALCSDGKVYSWGSTYGQTGIHEGQNSNPTEVRALAEKKIVSVDCNEEGSVALSDEGEVYRWGRLMKDQASIAPSRITNLVNIVIRKLVCGKHHILALTEEGVIYAWGSNDFGQLGIGTKRACEEPTRVPNFEERIIDIASNHTSDTSAAMSETYKVYMWGSCRGPCILRPFLTQSSSLHEVFLNHSDPLLTYEALKPNTRPMTDVAESVRQAFDNAQTSDLTLVVGGKGIKVHKAILKIRCEYFRTMFKQPWSENAGNQIALKLDRNHKIYRAFLQYLYTDEVDLSPEDTLELYNLANEFCVESLKELCEQNFRSNINVQNCISLWLAAVRFQATQLTDFCLIYIANHMSEAVRTTSFLQLDGEVVKKLILEVSNRREVQM